MMGETEDIVEVVFTAVAPLDRMEEYSISLKADTRKMMVVGNIPELGGWSLVKGVTLLQEKADEKEVIWKSAPVQIARNRLPFKYRFIANGHRNSPTTRPLIWDRVSRTSTDLLDSNAKLLQLQDQLQFTEFNSDSGWVTSSGVGAYQLRVGQPPGSKEPLIVLDEGTELKGPFKVALFEAKARDPNVPEGKAFKTLSTFQSGLSRKSTVNLEDAPLEEDNVTFLMNGQSIDALAFRVDVTSQQNGSLLARGYVSHHTLKSLEGSISASLITPELKQIGLFKAGFLVVTALDLQVNNLTDLQRSRWSHAAATARGTLDIGHRGAGASIGRDGSQRSVRENTLLSFQKAAINHSDFIEFDVHVTSDSEVVVHHDFDVKLAVGNQQIALGIPVLTYAQLSSNDFTHAMVGSSSHAPFLEAQQKINQRIMKRNNSSAEDMVRRMIKPNMSGPTKAEEESLLGLWRISDKIATLREAFRSTPKWLGFNIELKYPTVAQLSAMHFRFYDRNYFCDSILKVVLEEAGSRKVIFSTFDPDCATLLSLKQPRFPVFFLTCAGGKIFTDPRMNSLEAAFAFAKSSNLQGVVAESSLLLDRLKDVTVQFHENGLYLFTWGEANNKWENYSAQKSYGLDGIILDDVARVTKACGKRSALFNRPIKSPASYLDMGFGELDGLRSPNTLQGPSVGFADSLKRGNSVLGSIHELKVST